MRASKENARNAMKALTTLVNRLETSDSIGHDAADQIGQFINAALRKLPSEAAYDREKGGTYDAETLQAMDDVNIQPPTKSQTAMDTPDMMQSKATRPKRK